MATKIKYTATAPDGTIATRTSARTYSHAVFVEATGTDGKTGSGCWAWSGRLDLATKEANRLRKMVGRTLVSGDHVTAVHIVPVSTI